METTKKDLEYYRKNAEEDYLTTPISVLRYISEMEQEKHYGYSCPKCGFDFVGVEPYEVDGKKYPLISGEYWIPEHNWDETHKCNKCKILVEFSDGV